MSKSEMAVLYYVANLLLLKRASKVRSLCEQHLIYMNNGSSMFRANIHRYLALAQLKAIS